MRGRRAERRVVLAPKLYGEAQPVLCCGKKRVRSADAAESHMGEKETVSGSVSVSVSVSAAAAAAAAAAGDEDEDVKREA
jgi:hypothetical protein